MFYLFEQRVLDSYFLKINFLKNAYPTEDVEAPIPHLLSKNIVKVIFDRAEILPAF